MIIEGQRFMRVAKAINVSVLSLDLRVVFRLGRRVHPNRFTHRWHVDSRSGSHSVHSTADCGYP